MKHMDYKFFFLVLFFINCSGFYIMDEKDADSNSRNLIAGKTALLGSFPSTVRMNGCTSAKIGPRLFLTAAHCEISRIRSSTNVKAFLENNNINMYNSVTITDYQAKFYTFEIKNLYIHPAYEKICKINCPNNTALLYDVPDVAIIEISADTPQIPLAKVSFNMPKPGDPLIIQGYGCVDNLTNHSGGGTLKFNQSNVVKISGSYLYSPGVNYLQESQGQDEASASICPGDSGGPVYIDDGKNDKIIGVNAYYTFESGKDVSDTNMHTLLVNTASYKVGDWINCVLNGGSVETCKIADSSAIEEPTPVRIPDEYYQNMENGNNSDSKNESFLLNSLIYDCNVAGGSWNNNKHDVLIPGYGAIDDKEHLYTKYGACICNNGGTFSYSNFIPSCVLVIKQSPYRPLPKPTPTPKSRVINNPTASASTSVTATSANTGGTCLRDNQNPDTKGFSDIPEVFFSHNCQHPNINNWTYDNCTKARANCCCYLLGTKECKLCAIHTWLREAKLE